MEDDNKKWTFTLEFGTIQIVSRGDMGVFFLTVMMGGSLSLVLQRDEPSMDSRLCLAAPSNIDGHEPSGV